MPGRNTRPPITSTNSSGALKRPDSSKQFNNIHMPTTDLNGNYELFLTKPKPLLSSMRS